MNAKLFLHSARRNARQLAAGGALLLLLALLHVLMVTWWLPHVGTAPAVRPDTPDHEDAVVPPDTREPWYKTILQSKPPGPRLAPPPPLHNAEPTLPPDRKRAISTSAPSLPPKRTTESSVVPPPGKHTGAGTPTTTDATTTTTTTISPEESVSTFYANLELYEANLKRTDIKGNPEQPTKDFVDIDADVGTGSPLPYDPTFVEDPAKWEACDPRNASFTVERDRLCQAYLGNVHNMRSIKAMSSKLLQGRTIKMQIYYAHNNIKTIVKLSQRKFYFEAASEFLAFSFDRALEFNRVPTSVFVPIPLDYLRAAVAYSPLFSQWFDRYVVLYNNTSQDFVECSYHTRQVAECSMATVQLWMKDVHAALDTFLGLPFELDDGFIRKYYIPGHELFAGTKRARLRAVGELSDRSIFDFLIGNTDRGMNDHNNFVYGGCSAETECQVEDAENRIKGLAKYAYIDHGSSLYSHKEPPESPFFGNVDRIRICRYRQSTYDHLAKYRSTSRVPYPLIKHVDQSLPPEIYKVSHESVVRKVQVRLDKMLYLIDNCRTKYTDAEVFSLPEYDQIRIAEEDATLGAEWD